MEESPDQRAYFKEKRGKGKGIQGWGWRELGQPFEKANPQGSHSRRRGGGRSTRGGAETM